MEICAYGVVEPNPSFPYCPEIVEVACRPLPMLMSEPSTKRSVSSTLSELVTNRTMVPVSIQPEVLMSLSVPHLRTPDESVSMVSQPVNSETRTLGESKSVAMMPPEKVLVPEKVESILEERFKVLALRAVEVRFGIVEVAVEETVIFPPKTESPVETVNP